MVNSFESTYFAGRRQSSGLATSGVVGHLDREEHSLLVGGHLRIGREPFVQQRGCTLHAPRFLE